MNDTKIGENIRKIRELKGFSQDYMASQLNISQRAYSNIESGNRKMDKELLEQVASTLDIDPLRLITFDEKILFKDCHQSGWFLNTINGLGDKERESYEAHITTLKEENQKLWSEIEFLRSLIKKES